MTGKGLAFLNKKSWHTSTLHNQELVWLAEQKDANEKKRIEQWKREKMEEQKIAELRALQDAASGRVRQQRVDWIYEAPVSKTTSNEEYLLGKKIETFDEVNGETPVAEKKEIEATEEKPGMFGYAVFVYFYYYYCINNIILILFLKYIYCY
jgi:hypothetical protein